MSTLSKPLHLLELLTCIQIYCIVPIKKLTFISPFLLKPELLIASKFPVVLLRSPSLKLFSIAETFHQCEFCHSQPLFPRISPEILRFLNKGIPPRQNHGIHRILPWFEVINPEGEACGFYCLKLWGSREFFFKVLRISSRIYCQLQVLFYFGTEISWIFMSTLTVMFR